MTEAESPEDRARRRVDQYYNGRAEFLIHLTIFVLINGVLWGVWAFMRNAYGQPPVWPWPLVLSLPWGAGLLGHALDLRAKSPGRLAALERTVSRQMTELYGPDWSELEHDEVYQRLYEASFQRLTHNTEFAIHVGVFVLINVLVWLLWLSWAGHGGFALPLLLTVPWGIGLGGHAAANAFDASRSVVARERAVQQAMGQAKPKRKRLQQARAILTDDGELLEVVDDLKEPEDDRLQDERH